MTGSPPPHVPWHLLESSSGQCMLRALHALLERIDLELSSLDKGGNIKLPSGRESSIGRLRINSPRRLSFLAFTGS